MFCSKCGKEVQENARFCASCGNRVEQKITKENVALNEDKSPKTQKSKKALISIICVMVGVLLIASCVFVAISMIDNDTDNGNKQNNSSVQSSEKELLNDGELSDVLNQMLDKNNVTNNQLQANFSAWCMSCNVDKDIYFSDMENGIYLNNSNNLFVAGSYGDLCYFNGKIVCVEYSNGEKFERIVCFDIETKGKTEVYIANNIDDYFAFCNIVNGRLYFTINGDSLFVCNKDWSVENTGIRDARGVSEKGVYTTQYSERGLRLVTFGNKEIKSFDSLSQYDAWVRFELNGKLYLSATKDNYGTVEYLIVDIKTGEVKEIKNAKIFDEVVNINFKDDTLYIIGVKIEDEKRKNVLCKSKLDGSNIEYLQELYEVEDYYFNMMNVLDDKIYFAMPYTNNQPKFVKIN